MKYPSFFQVDTNIDKIHQYLAASAFIFSVSSKLHSVQKSKNCNIWGISTKVQLAGSYVLNVF